MFETQDTGSSNNALLTYLRSQSPETLEQVAKYVSPEIHQIIHQNIQGLVGMMPSPQFQVSVTTNHENLANLLGSAMMTGYFLSQMETRMRLDSALNSGISEPKVPETQLETDSNEPNSEMGDVIHPDV
jgi:Protein of unknown function (DUF760)